MTDPFALELSWIEAGGGETFAEYADKLEHWKSGYGYPLTPDLLNTPLSQLVPFPLAIAASLLATLVREAFPRGRRHNRHKRRRRRAAFVAPGIIPPGGSI